ncbi:MAG: S8 family peptidase [Acidobacteriota bacterium]
MATDGQSKTEQAAADKGRKNDPGYRRQEQFDPRVLDRSVLAVPLLREFEKSRRATSRRFDVIIDLNLRFPGGLRLARDQVESLLEEVVETLRSRRGRKRVREIAEILSLDKSELTPQYLFGELTEAEIRLLVERDRTSKEHRGIYRVWFDFPIEARLDRSCATIKADAARVSFGACGRRIVWAVVDSGIDETHPHFAQHGNLKLPDGIDHQDFTTKDDPLPLRDGFGHGTHVAGIIAGEWDPEKDRERADPPSDREAGPEILWAAERERDHTGEETVRTREVERIAGVAPECKLLSLKVLEDDGTSGRSSDLICALAYVQQCNQHGRDLRIHGVNMSLGYGFDPEWFACGQSPLCVEVDRLVASGVVVVAAAGNTGYGWVSTKARGTSAAGLDMTINDPGNADRAITVGATHRDMTHVYGVSYFSSKGPTGDGRLKPDLIAPGERILSCAAGTPRADLEEQLADDRTVLYRQESGTSMAAPHVSGAIAAFLSIRREFIGRPERVKEIFLASATDLGRERYFQGHGLIDLMRAIQSI